MEVYVNKNKNKRYVSLLCLKVVNIYCTIGLILCNFALVSSLNFGLLFF